MENPDMISIATSVIALGLSVFSIWISERYSRISVLHSLHEIVLQKAKDCNSLFQSALDSTNRSGNDILKDIQETNMVSEVIISVQLLDNSLKQYNLTDRRDFFLLQFWIQLQTSPRIFIKNSLSKPLPSDADAQKNLIAVTEIFKAFFEDY